MKITSKEVEYVARLARLSLSEKEKEKMTAQLDSILQYMDTLNKLDTNNIEPTSHVLPLNNVWREDVARPSTPRDKILANAPDQAEGFYKVKKVIE
ncbi:MAG: Asp-tRNA(Asn)/Glu-tRNA(Gln) amidotransferase subunit GatC [bacterium]|nr:Asp-tRNA(Asn)/Glu-tRNA(Gln) amidotransferase subunit GatC [bacterium]MDD5354338.1 Asp-tRNA(Asn)/Glu-tRNA(Gln) amidotransferase subunit GatC [bacterium]MDD5757067.1 Asp-tRNA(Asn)/Glu-tRNA(Gln) amidotransferase subunit GatC [bacterium]